MNTVSPNLASTWAKEAYTVTNQILFKAFVDDASEFSTEPSSTTRLTAEVGSRLINVQDHFAICARGSGQWHDSIFIIFRGSTTRNNYADWVANARAGVSVSSTGAMVHTGFNHIFGSMTNQLSDFITAQHGVTTVHCIGHSLGGAIANLCAEWVKTTHSKQVKLYSFGAPRVSFGAGFSQKLETALLPENIYRVYQSNDPVPMVPIFPFMHSPFSGKSYCIGGDGGIISGDSHSMAKAKVGYAAKVSGARNWNELYHPEPVLTKAAIKAWLSGEYDDNPNQLSFWNKLNSAFSYLVQFSLGVTVMPLFAGAVTLADQLAMILQKGLNFAGEASDWAFSLIKKMMRALGMKVAETIEALTEQLIRLVLNRLIQMITNQVARALDTLR